MKNTLAYLDYVPVSELGEEDELPEQLRGGASVAGGQSRLSRGHPLLTAAEVVAVQVDSLDGDLSAAEHAPVHGFRPSGRHKLQVLDLVEGGTVYGPCRRYRPA